LKQHLLLSRIVLFIGLFLTGILPAFAQPCDPSTPTFTVNLTGNPSGTWISPVVTRDGLCCTSTSPDRCIEFIITLDPAAQGIIFNIASGAIPPGAMFYQVSCGNPTPVGSLMCLNGPGPHRITFCKPGNNNNSYSITSVPAPQASPPIAVSDGCSGIIYASGYDQASITWQPVPANPTYYSYMSCTTGCDTVLITAQPGYPSSVLYQVCGYPAGACNNILVCDTVRVYFVTDKTATINPQNPVICFGGPPATLTANGTGGYPPYIYLWSTGATTQSISATAGTYWVKITDGTNCPAVFDTVTVVANPSPISANAGSDLNSCANNSSVTLNGSVVIATGGIWSGGAGTYNPNNTTLNATYTPSAGEISTGNINLTLTTTGNAGCPPSSDNMLINIGPAPTASAGPDKIVCSDVTGVSLAGTFTVASGGTWTTSGTGTFSPNSNVASPTYIPSSADTAAGSVTLTFTTTGNGTCLPVSDNMILTLTNAPIVNAGPDLLRCSDAASIPLTGLVSTATGGTWTSSGTGTFSPNANALNASYIPSSADTTAGSVTLTLTTTGNGTCNAVNDNTILTLTNVPTSNAGPNLTRCSDITSVPLTGLISTATGGTWTTSGTGTFSPNANTLNASYIPSSADTTAGAVTLTLTTTGNGGCNAVSDNTILTLTNAPISNAGPNLIRCSDITSVLLTGLVSTATGGTWTTSGTGTFNPNANTLNASYIPSSADTAVGTITLTLTTTGNGTCNAVSDNTVLTLTNAPTANAGPNLTSCSDVTSISLTGLISTATGGTWTTSGAGTFSPNANTLNASYIPSSADTAAGTITLTLTTTGNGTCNAVNDNTILTLTNAPTSNAGPNLTRCSDVTSVPLTGLISTATGGTWTTSGTGTFSPNANTLNASYIPSSADTAAGTITLTLTTTGNGTCNAVNDNTVLTLTNAPVSNAGANIITCSDVTSVPLSGLVSTATGGTWTTNGTGTFNPNANTLNATYIPSSTDTAAGTITLTLTTTGNGTCNAASDNTILTLTNAPTSNAGPNLTNCSDVTSVALTGLVSTATGGTWTSSGTGTFNPNANTLNASYIPSSADTAAGTVTLTLTTTGNGGCNAVTDNMILTLTNAPTVDAGASITICADAASVPVSGLVTTATGGTWSTSGTGTFTPNASTLNASYIPSSADTAAGTITLTLTTTGNGTCNAVTDNTVLTITNAPTANAGPDQVLCSDVSGITLSGLISTATGGTWTTSGTGTFSPDSTTLGATYIPSSADTAAGSVTLTLITTGNGGCNAVSDAVTFTLTNAPTINAGADLFTCSTNPNAVLSGLITTSTGGTWTTSGTGTFSPNANTLNATYIPSNADTAAGAVTLTLTSTGNGTCNTVTDNVVVTITPDAIAVSAGNDQLICSTSVPLSGMVSTATGGVWSTSGTGTFTPNDSTLNATYIFSTADTTAGSVTLVLTTTGNGGCAAKADTVTFSIAPPISITASGPDTVCANGGTVALTGAVSTTQGVWSSMGSGTFSNNNSLSTTYTPSNADTAAGSVSLILTSANNGVCPAITDTVTVELIPSPFPAFSNTSACLNQTTSFTDLSTTAGGITGWSWNFGDTGSSTSSNPTHTYNSDGTYNVVLTVTSNNGCVSTITQPVTVHPLPAAAFSSTAQCFVDSVFFTDLSTVTSGTVNSWSWSFGDNGTSSSQDPGHFYTAPGTYTVQLIVASSFGCIDTITQNVTAQPSPLAEFGNSTVCLNAATSFTDSSTILFGSIVSWAWSFGDNGTSSTQNPAHTYASPGTYNVTLVVTSAIGCSDTLVQQVNVNPLPQAAFDATGLCLSDGTMFTDLSTVSPGSITSWQWDFGDSNQSTQQNPTNFYPSQGSYNVTLIVQSAAGCLDTITQAYSVNPSPVASFSPTSAIVNPGETINFTDGSTGSSTWYWEFGDNTGTSTQQNPSYTYSLGGIYTVTEIVTNAFGCTDTIDHEVIVTLPPDVATGFTPNGDGVNDVLYVMGGPFAKLEFKIYNNWGELIFISTNQADGWDGTRNGVLQPVGVYVFTVTATTEDGLQHQVSGDVTLLR
jgi:gliding motility-associated-like protein